MEKLQVQTKRLLLGRMLRALLLVGSQSTRDNCCVHETLN
jgi:hypothetical protein